MKKIIITATALALTAAASFIACRKYEEAHPSLSDTFAQSVGTKSSDPFDMTLWRCETGERFDRFIYFHEGLVSLFYGRKVVDGFERWTDNYDGSYKLRNDELTVEGLLYPKYGDHKLIWAIDFLRMDDGWNMSANDGEYIYVGQYTDDLERIWMTLDIKIMPWN